MVCLMRFFVRCFMRFLVWFPVWFPVWFLMRFLVWFLVPFLVQPPGRRCPSWRAGRRRAQQLTWLSASFRVQEIRGRELYCGGVEYPTELVGYWSGISNPR